MDNEKIFEVLESIRKGQERQEKKLDGLQENVAKLQKNFSELSSMQEEAWKDIGTLEKKIDEVKLDTEAIRARVSVNTMDIEELKMAR